MYLGNELIEDREVTRIYKSQEKQELIEASNLSNSTGKLREYKDRLFKFLFKDRIRLLSLYNALNNSSYDDSSELIVVDLDNSLCLGMRGDLSYILSSSIWLYEEQSSWNPNMPLRMLFQISDIYKSLINRKQLYRNSQILLKNPHFITFYCGDTKYFDRDEIKLKLSDAYEKKEETSDLELIVRVININPGYNENIIDACESLRGYMLLNEKVKEYKLNGEFIDVAVSHAIKYCIKNNILSDFLKEYQKEVEIMLGEIYTFEDYKSDMEEEREFIMAELDDLREERDAVREERDAVREERDAVREELDDLREERDAVREELQKKDELIKYLQLCLERENSNL